MPESSSLAELLGAGLKDLDGLNADPVLTQRLLDYLALLGRWNRTYNLTAVRNPAEMITRHLLDSLSVLPWVPGQRLLDAGTGAGLPGVPLAIARPDLDVILLDSSGKKVRFLNHVRRELGLQNAHPVQARLEQYDPPNGFDAVVSRALAGLASFAGAVRHLAGTARLLAMKGRYPANELAELPDWVEVKSIEKLSIPGLQENRHLVIMSVNP